MPLPTKVPAKDLDEYRRRMAEIIALGQQEWNALGYEERRERSAEMGKRQKERVMMLRRSLGIDPWPRGVDLFKGYQ